MQQIDEVYSLGQINIRNLSDSDLYKLKRIRLDTWSKSWAEVVMKLADFWIEEHKKEQQDDL